MVVPAVDKLMVPVKLFALDETRDVANQLFPVVVTFGLSTRRSLY